MPRLGTRKLYYLLKEDLSVAGIKMGRDVFFDYLRKHNMLVKPRRSFTKTTYSKHWMKKHPGLRPHLSLGMKTPNEVHKKANCKVQLA